MKIRDVEITHVINAIKNAGMEFDAVYHIRDAALIDRHEYELTRRREHGLEVWCVRIELDRMNEVSMLSFGGDDVAFLRDMTELRLKGACDAPSPF